MSIENAQQDIATLCIGETSDEGLSEHASPEQIKALLDKRQSVGRRNIGRLTCEVEGCAAIRTIAVRDGRPELHRPMSDITNLLSECVYWNSLAREI